MERYCYGYVKMECSGEFDWGVHYKLEKALERVTEGYKLVCYFDIQTHPRKIRKKMLQLINEL